MSDFVISTRYALALMELAEKNNTFEKVFSDIQFVSNTIKDSKELRNFLASPIIESSTKLEVLTEIFQNHVDDDVNKFLRFVTQKGRENYLNDICSRFIELSNDKLNKVEVTITSAIDLTNEQREELEEKLKAKLKKEIIPDYKVDKSIIGGFKARYKDTVIDASIKHQLEILKQKFFEDSYLKN